MLNTFLVTGPMSRFCADLIPMYRVLAAENVNKLKLDSKVIETFSIVLLVQLIGKLK